MKKHDVILLTLLTGLFGCGSNEETEHLTLSADCPQVAYSSNITEKVELVIQDEANYLHYREQVNLDTNSPLLDIDFTQNMILLVSSGQRGSSGYHIEIERVEEKETTIDVHYTSTMPPTNDSQCNQDTAITYPYCFAVTEASDKTVNFVETIRQVCL